MNASSTNSLCPTYVRVTMRVALSDGSGKEITFWAEFPAPDLISIPGQVWPANQGPEAFVLDWAVLKDGRAVLKDGRTVLIEANDAYACGAYGTTPWVYAAALMVRCVHLTQGRQNAVTWADGLLKQ